MCMVNSDHRTHTTQALGFTEHKEIRHTFNNKEVAREG